MTTQEVIEKYVGEHKQLSLTALDDIAYEYDIPAENLEAVVLKESHRGPFIEHGLVPILYEPHIFSRLTQHEFDNTHPDLSRPNWDRSVYGSTGINQYKKLNEACALHEEAALKSCSWGMFQIMGFNYEDAGYETVHQMVKAYANDAQNQLDSFICFLQSKGLITALRNWDVERFAYHYNGPRYAENHYVEGLNKYRALANRNTLRLNSRGFKVMQVQQRLKELGYLVTVDGHFGPNTATAVTNFQLERQLYADGIVGPKTLSELMEA